MAEEEKTTGRRRGRPPAPWGPTERLFVTAPPGTKLLVDQLVTVMRRLNGSGFTDGALISEAGLALAKRMMDHPQVTPGERMILAERSELLDDLMRQFYENQGVENPTRP